MNESFPIKLDVPQYVFEVPSTQEKVAFRPFLVGEQKSLMLALATENTNTITNAIKSIIEVCSSGKANPAKLTSFDLEYLFLQLRAKSIGETVQLNANCNKCKELFSFSIDISQADVDYSTAVDPKIMLTEEIGVQMRYPNMEETFRLYSEEEKNNPMLIDITIDCIEKIWNSTELVNTKDYKRERIVEFFNTLTVAQAKQLTDFVLLMPSVKVLKKVRCAACGHENLALIEGLENFFG